MRNLRNVRYDRWTQPGITATCWDPESDAVLALTGPDEGGSVALLRFQEMDSAKTIATWTAPSPNPSLPTDRPLSLHHLSGTSQTVLVFAGGDIVLVTQEPTTEIEIIGTIDSGIAAARWSPDEELLLVVTNEKNVIFMNSQFDPVSEIRMTEEDLKASKHVSVGWGKRETQFQGRGARAMRDPTIPERVDEGTLSQNDQSDVHISWRGDGQYVAVSGIDGGRRVIRVFSREGELDSASEPVDGLEATISWRPSGNLIASIQRKPEQVDVVFFERNGLRHGEFTLRSPSTDFMQETNIQLEWNADSTVLAVCLSKVLQFWTMGNYHWYLKQEIPLNKVTAVSWHPEKSMRLSLGDVEGLVSTEHTFHTARGQCAPPHDTGAVAVIDGEQVKLTAFQTANIPPPMSQFEVAAKGAVIDVAFGPDNGKFAILHRNGVDTYEWPLKNGRSTKPALQSTVKFDDSVAKGLLGISSNSEGAFAWIEAAQKELAVPGDHSSTHRLVTLSVDGQIQLSQSLPAQLFPSNTTFFGQNRYGKIHSLAPSNEVPPTFPSNLPSFELAHVAGVDIAFGLSRTGNLYANTRQLVKNCTSFLLTPDHLIFTTNNHFVKYVHLLPNVDELDIPADDPETDERVRSVERGAKLVTAMPTRMCIVLQMPRGNLETIFPRAMVLSGIRRCVDEKDYGKAFAYCRTQRVDMNILYDHKPTQFVDSVGLFLDQLNDVGYIDLFLSSLREEDVTQTMYRDTRRPAKAQPPTTPSASKVNTICDALLAALESRSGSNLQNIITAHVCKSPPALEDALILVASLHANSSAQAERAVEHICFLIDVNRLYDTALGLYNLELALLVAQQSQRDPREYLPFIQNLHALEEHRRKFQIDDHLNRRDKALTHLYALSAFDELCEYTQKHVLYSSALRLYRHNAPTQLAALTGLYAEHLESISSHREAGLAYESLGNFAKATTCYRTAGASSWQECLYCAAQQSMAPEPLADLATALADALTESKDHAAAAEIYLNYLASPALAIKSLCKASQFASALRLVPREPDSFLPVFDTALTDALSSTTEFLSDCKAQLAAQIPRIHLLREKALADPLSFYEGDIPASALNIPDDVSVATTHVSTSASLFTRYTGKQGASTGTLASGVSRATSRNRKREEKKRARGRKGTVYEEEYLVNSTHRLITRVESTKPEVERLVFALCRRGMAERARAVEGLMEEVNAACEKAVEEVFGGVEKSAEEEGEAEGAEVWKPVGGDAVLQDWEMARRKKMDVPLVGKLKKLHLLGA